VKTSKERTTPNDTDQLSTALDLLREILNNGTNRNRRYCVYCKTNMSAPRELHRKDCV